MTIGPRRRLPRNWGRICDSLPSQNFRPGIPDFFQKPVGVLLFFGFEFEIPVINFRPVGYLRRVQEDPHPFSLVFIVQGEGEAAHVDHLEPAVADGAGGEKSGWRPGDNSWSRRWRRISTSAGNCRRATSTMIPPRTTPGATLPWKDLTSCRNSSKEWEPIFMTLPHCDFGLRGLPPPKKDVGGG